MNWELDPRNGTLGYVNSAIGSLLGLAVGDSIGLPYENLSPPRARSLLGPPDRHRLLLGWGMVSDDTEHACMTAAALIRSGGDPDRFARELARQLRWWIASLPAGTGLATARSAARVWLGWSPSRSGVWSAGNGPAMRAPILGAIVDDPARLRRLVEVSTRLTHTDPRATDGAMVAAIAASIAARDGGLSSTALRYALQASAVPCDVELARLLAAAIDSAGSGEATAAFAANSGWERGVSGFIVHTIPIAIHACLSADGDFRTAIRSCVECGGDTDTTAAIAGGILGAGVGANRIPADWLHAIWAAPRSVSWMRRLAETAAAAVAERRQLTVPAYPWPLVPLRNLAFAIVVLGHGLRRLIH